MSYTYAIWPQKRSLKNWHKLAVVLYGLTTLTIIMGCTVEKIEYKDFLGMPLLPSIHPIGNESPKSIGIRGIGL